MRPVCLPFIILSISACTAVALGQTTLTSDKSLVLSNISTDQLTLTAGGKYAHVLRHTTSGTRRSIYQRYSYSLTKYREDTIVENGSIYDTVLFADADKNGGATIRVPLSINEYGSPYDYQRIGYIPPSGPVSVCYGFDTFDRYSSVEVTPVSSQIRIAVAGSTRGQTNRPFESFVGIMDPTRTVQNHELFNTEFFPYDGEDRTIFIVAADSAHTGVSAVAGGFNSPQVTYVRQISYNHSPILAIGVPFRDTKDICILPVGPDQRSRPHDMYLAGKDRIAKFSPSGALVWEIVTPGSTYDKIDHVDIVGLVAKRVTGTTVEFLFLTPTGNVTRTATVPVTLNANFTYRVDSAGQISIYDPVNFPNRLMVLDTSGVLRTYNIPGTSLGYLDLWNNVFFLSKDAAGSYLNVSYNLQPLATPIITLKRGSNTKVFLDLRVGAPRTERQATLSTSNSARLTVPAVAEFNPGAVQTNFRVTAPASATPGIAYAYASYAGRKVKLQVNVTL